MNSEQADSTPEAGTRPQRAAAGMVREFAAAVLIAAGTDPEAAHSVADALTETSLRGVDSHGIRLLVHYAKVVQTGRINPKPRLTFTRASGAAGTVDADNGFGHHASYFAVEHAIALAREEELRRQIEACCPPKPPEPVCSETPCPAPPPFEEPPPKTQPPPQLGPPPAK